MDEEANVPSDLMACIERARALSMDWIMFDCDGTLVPGLAQYNDETPSPSSHNTVLMQQLPVVDIDRVHLHRMQMTAS